MESPTQQCARLVSALEEIASQEAICLKAHDFAELAAVQERAGPVVEYLAQHGPAVADVSLRQRIAAILQQRRASEAWMEQELARLRRELDDLQTSSRRVAQVAPVYGSQKANSAGRLHARG